MNKNSRYISGGMLILLGILFIVLRGSVISIALTVVGAVLLAMGILDLVNHVTTPGVLKTVAGAFVILFGWLLVNLAIYLLAALLIAFGVVQIVDYAKTAATRGTGAMIVTYARPVISILAGLCLLFNRGGAINGFFVAAGILLIVEGVLELLN